MGITGTCAVRGGTVLSVTPPAILCAALTAASLVFFFFFQAEDGIRDWSVTGVQTCALPIYLEQRISCSDKHSPDCDWPHNELPDGNRHRCPVIRCISREVLLDLRAEEIEDRKSVV